MTKYIKNIFKTVFIAFVPFLFFSCDKIDCNGDLDGQWQMTEWISPTGEIIGNKDLQLYYSFQLQMMMFQRFSSPSAQQRSLFEHRGTSIRIYNPFLYVGDGHDEFLSMDVLQRYGVPYDGIMEIEHLSSNKLILSSAERGRLTFRKY